MAKLLFIQLNEYELHGLESLSATLKSQGHKVELLVPYFEKKPLARIKEFSPDLIGFPVASMERAEALSWAWAIKPHFQGLIILGGIDATFFPKLVQEKAVDIVCRGEGENALLGLANALDEKADFCKIKNLWVKRDGEIDKNPIGDLIENLDELPFPDKELYFSRYPYFRNYPIKFFIASRGCPYSCSYCANKGLRELYPNPNSYLRFKSPDYLLEEIKQVVLRYPTRTVGFNDDLFIYDQRWLERFLPLYRNEIGIPFFCAGRIDLVNKEKAMILKEGGCYSFWYGLESADEAHREEILNRKMSNEEIEVGVELLHQYGIKSQSYNILNYPGEGLKEGLATLDFNRKIKNDFVVSSLFQPFPGTELTKKLKEEERLGDKNNIAKIESLSYFAFSPFRQKDSKKLEHLHKLFILGFHSKLVRKLLPILVRLPKNPLFDILFLISFGLDYGRVHRLNWWEIIKYNAIHIRTTYLRRKVKVPKRQVIG